MKKFKKILAAAMAAAIAISTTSVVSATGVAADDCIFASGPDADSIYTFGPGDFKYATGPDAEFTYAFGYSDMANLSNISRYGSARIEIINRTTNVSDEVKTRAKVIGAGLSVTARPNNNNYSETKYKSVCSGNIHSRGNEQSPVDWEIETSI